MRKIMMAIVSIFFLFVLVACDDFKNLAPRVNRRDLVEMSDWDKEQLINSIELSYAELGVVEVLVKGDINYSYNFKKATVGGSIDPSEINKSDLTIKTDISFYYDYSEIVKDFVMYIKIDKSNMNLQAVDLVTKEVSTVEISFYNSFMLIHEGHIYYQFNIRNTKTVGDKITEENIYEKGKIVNGFVLTHKSMIDSKLMNPYNIKTDIPIIDGILGDMNFSNSDNYDYSKLNIYKRNNKTIIEQKEVDFTEISGNYLEDDLVKKMLEKYKDLIVIDSENLIELVDGKVATIYSFANGSVKNMSMDIYGLSVDMSFDFKDVGVVFRANRSLPKLPDVSNFKEEKSLPEINIYN